MGIVYLLGIFLPLFLATGLIREEMSEGTMHYMLAKPIARGEVLLLQDVRICRDYMAVHLTVCLGLCLITGFTGPSDGVFRWEDVVV